MGGIKGATRSLDYSSYGSSDGMVQCFWWLRVGFGTLNPKP